MKPKKPPKTKKPPAEVWVVCWRDGTPIAVEQTRLDALGRCYGEGDFVRRYVLASATARKRAKGKR